MSSHNRKARWLALTAGLVFMGAGILDAEVSVLQTEADRSIGPVTILDSFYIRWNGPNLAVDDAGRAFTDGFHRYPAPPPWTPPIGAPEGPPYGPVTYGYMDGDSFVVGYAPGGRNFYSAFVAGPALDRIEGLAVDSSALYVAREALDTEGTWVYVDKLGSAGVGPSLYSLEVLWGHWATVNDIAVDTSGNAYITGRTGSRSYYDYNNPYFEAAYIAKIDEMGAVRFMQELDGMGYDEGSMLDVDEEGNVYVTGITYSPDFPVTGGQGAGNRFVAKIGPSGNVIYSTRWNGGEILEIAAAGEGEVRLLLSGLTLGRLDDSGALASTHPLHGAVGILVGAAFGPANSLYLAGKGLPSGHPNNPGCYFNAVARIDLASGLSVSTCLPGVTIDKLAVDGTGNAYVTGGVFSEGIFPKDGIGQWYLAKLSFNRPPDCSGAKPSLSTVWPPNGKLVSIAIRGVADPDGDPVTLKITGIRQDEPLSRNGEADALGLGTPAAQVRADRAGVGDGRVYHLSFEARDDKGATCTGTVKVCIPHDQRPGATCGDGGALFDSAGK